MTTSLPTFFFPFVFAWISSLDILDVFWGNADNLTFLVSLLFYAFAEFLLACVVLLHNQFLFVAAKHRKIGLHIHWIVDTFFERGQSHLVHLIQHVSFGEPLRTSCLESQFFELIQWSRFNHRFICSLRQVNFIDVLVIELFLSLISKYDHFLTVEGVIFWNVLRSVSSYTSLGINWSHIHVSNSSLVNGWNLLIVFAINCWLFVFIHCTQRW